MKKQKELTAEEKQEEYRGRVESFLKELEPLLMKYELTVGAEMMLSLNGITAKPVFPDKK